MAPPAEEMRAQGETSPLVVAHESEDDDVASQASVFQTILNLMKSCMGTGSFALAYACQQGGIVVFLVGLVGVTAWNVYSVQRLCQCLKYIPSDDTTKQSPEPSPRRETPDETTASTTLEEGYRIRTTTTTITTTGAPPEGTTTLGVVAWYAFGPTALRALDSMLLLFFFGVLVAYLAALKDFLHDTPFTLGNVWDCILSATIMASLSLVPNVGYLSKVSAAGLLVLVASFVVIAICGLFAEPEEGEQGETTTSIPAATWNLWPESLVGLSHWFGIVVLGYGIVPLTYNFHESMAEPDRLVEATAMALSGVAVLYVFIGFGLYLLFPHVQGEILHELGGGVVPVLTRLAMVWVVFMTAPLLIIPCSELLEGKWGISGSDHASSSLFIKQRDLVRFGIMAVAVCIAVLVPSFVEVLAFLGCACMTFLGFCLPPIFHMRLLWKNCDPGENSRSFVLDGVLLAWGVFAAISSTLYIVGKLKNKNPG
jgi:amino acid permease